MSMYVFSRLRVVNCYTQCNSHHTAFCIQLMIFQWKVEVMHKIDRKQCTLIFKKNKINWYIINSYSLILRKKKIKMIKVTEIVKSTLIGAFIFFSGMVFNSDQLHDCDVYLFIFCILMRTCFSIWSMYIPTGIDSFETYIMI